MPRVKAHCHQFPVRRYVEDLPAIPGPRGLCSTPTRDFDASTGARKGLDNDTCDTCDVGDPLAIGRESGFCPLGQRHDLFVSRRVDLEQGPVGQIYENQAPIRRPVQVTHNGRPFQQDLWRAGAVGWNNVYIVRGAVEGAVCDLSAVVGPDWRFVAPALGEASGDTARKIVHADEKLSIPSIVGGNCQKASVGRKTRFPVAGVSDLTEFFATLIEQYQLRNR